MAVVSIPAAAGGHASAGGGKPRITIVENPWTASALNAEIAKQLIEEHLGNDVAIVAIDENAMFAGMESGDLDAVLEVWPSGITADEQSFIEDGSVVELGELGVIGRIGWFVPDYVIEEFPEVATWEGLQDPDIAREFATAETGGLGRFLGTDPSYSEYDETIIENLDLPFEVVFSGSEAATVAELDARVAGEEPILMYWWEPTAAVAKYNLVMVELPEYTDECYEDPAEIACDYPEDVLIKLASAELEAKDAAVYSLLQQFTLTNDDQLSMLPAVEIDREAPADVAADWIEANEDVWSAWLDGDDSDGESASTTEGLRRPQRATLTPREAFNVERPVNRSSVRGVANSRVRSGRRVERRRAGRAA